MSAKIKVGDQAPTFRLPDQGGNDVNLAQRIGKGPVVLYFYPKDFTAGCTMEAREFREMYEEFQRRGADVIGVSGDSVETHRRFAEEQELPFTLLSDVDDNVRDMYGAWSALGMPDRITYLIDRQGIVRMVFSSQMRPRKHAAEALRALEDVSAERVVTSAKSS